MKHRISIITVTYNAVASLQDLIESLRAQTDRDFEWVVVDAASTDGTLDMLTDANDMLTAMVSEPDFGIYHALNKALAIASGDYYLVIGADDRLHPDAIKSFNGAIDRTNADVLIAGIDTSLGCLVHKSRPYLGTVYHHAVGSLIRRQLHERFGNYSRRFAIAADQYFLAKVAAAPDTAIVGLDFISGVYSTTGISNQDAIGSISEFYRIRLETGGNFVMETALLLMRLTRYKLMAIFSAKQ